MIFSPYPWLASTAFFLLLAGFSVRHKKRDLHVALMSGGMALDLCLVLILEFGRGAVGIALGDTLTVAQNTHVIASTLAVLFYLPVFALGLIRWRNPRSSANLRHWHRRLGYCALACRTAGFFFMFSMFGRA